MRAEYPDKAVLDVIREAVRLSSNSIAKDPWQFASQVVGRLLPYRKVCVDKTMTLDEAKAAYLKGWRKLVPKH